MKTIQMFFLVLTILTTRSGAALRCAANYLLFVGRVQFETVSSYRYMYVTLPSDRS